MNRILFLTKFYLALLVALYGGSLGGFLGHIPTSDRTRRSFDLRHFCFSLRRRRANGRPDLMHLRSAWGSG